MENKGLDLTNVYDFARFICQDDMTCRIPAFHTELYELAQSDRRRLVIVAPRSFAKSTVYSKIYPLHQVVQGKCHINKITIVSATAALAEHWLREIKTHLEENPWLINQYGDGKTNKWTQDHIVWKRIDGTKCEVQAKGAGYQLRGFRPDIIILDDIDTDEGVRSSEQREKLLDWFNKALINTLEKESQLIMVGTLLHPLSLLANVMNRPDWTVRKYEAITPQGESLWPEKWPIEALRKREKEIGHLAFQSEFMNNPIVNENPIVVREWLHPYISKSLTFEKIKKDGLYTVCAIDPAIGRKETNDFTAIVSVSATYEREPKFYVRVGGVRRGHWPMNKQIAELDRTYKDVGGKLIVIETVAYQQALADEFRLYCENEHRYPQIREVKPDRDKERRAHAIAPMLEQGRVYFDHDDPMTCKLMDELAMFPTGDRDDLVDAFVYAMTELKKWVRRERTKTAGPYIVLPRQRRNEITGVV